MALTQTCLCLLTRTGGDGEPEVLLGHKKTGLGTGKIVALGGHVEERETAIQAAAREVKEESGIAVAARSGSGLPTDRTIMPVATSISAAVRTPSTARKWRSDSCSVDITPVSP